ncbi:cytochrome p 450 [Moniliophthora roreri]|nr:cytochrome p 450 [Moniliophthora roreri]
MNLVLTQTKGLVLLTLACAPLYYILKKITRNSLHNVPGPKSTSWLYGHFSELYGKKGRQPAVQAELAAKYGSTFSMQSLFGMRQLYTFDPKAMHYIFVKDCMSYEEPDAILRLIHVVFGPGILATALGDHHRKQRKILSPAFSVAHMKEQVPIFYEVAHKVQNSLIKQVKDGPKEVDMSSWMSRTALELIGQAGLGYSFDDLEENTRKDPFAHAIKALTPILGRLAGVSFLVFPWASRFGTPGFRRFVCSLFPWWKDLQEAKNYADDLWRMSTDIFRARKKVLEMGDEAKQYVGRGRDVLSLLLKENMKATNEDRLTEEELIAQMTTLINAATDTTSTGISQTLHLLATHPDIQRKLREEIDEAFQDGDASYEKLVSLPYLDAISRETLRMYPPFSRIIRVAKHDVVLPLSTPVIGVDGFPINEIAVPKNTEIHCSVTNGNRNPDVWGPDGAEWKPERWLQPLPKSVMDANMPGVYSHLMTFSAGQRSCIGFKFSQLEMKVVLALLVKTFEFSDAGKDIFWELTPITSPSVKGTGQPGMPIIVNLVKRD